MSRLGITADDVETTAETILANGENPTIEKIRILLGTGSNSTISKYLNEWRTKRLIASTQDMSSAKSPPDPVHAAVNQVWQQMREETLLEIQQIREQANEEVRLAKMQLEEAEISKEQSLKLYSELQNQFYQVSAEKELISLDVKALHQEIQILEERFLSSQQQFKLLEQQSTYALQEAKTFHATLLDNHKNEMQNNLLNHEKSMDSFKTMHENERQRQMGLHDALSTENKKKEQIILDLKDQIQTLHSEYLEIKTKLQFVEKERDDALQIMLAKDASNEAEKKSRNELEKILSALNEIKSKLHDDNLSTRHHLVTQNHFNNNMDVMLKNILDFLSIKQNLVVGQE